MGGVLIICIVVPALILGGLYTYRNNLYNKAVALIGEAKYEEATDILKSIVPFRDSLKLISDECYYSGYTDSLEMTDATEQFANKNIILQSKSDHLYISIAFDITQDRPPLYTRYDSPDKASVFQTRMTPDGWIIFESIDNGKCLSADLSNPLTRSVLAVTDPDNASSWECFRIYKQGNAYCIYAQDCKSFLSAVDEGNPSRPIRATGRTAGYWEEFYIDVVN